MIQCPECSAKLATYCTKRFEEMKLRYYSCDICGKKIVTKVIEREVVLKIKKK